MTSGRNTSTMPTDDFRCSAWTAASGVDPAGSAASFETLLVVETPLPWPDKAEKITRIRALGDIEGTRVQLVVPEADREGSDVLLTRWRHTTTGFEGEDFLVARTDVDAALVTLASGGRPPAVSVETAPAEVLICSHGSRDRCCGGNGTRLAIEARAALPATVRVRRTSHLGGHRFAPTALTFPDGRSWAHLDADTLTAIVERRTEPRDVRQHYRGHVALPGPAQAAEAALLVECGWHDGIGVSAAVDIGGDGTAVTVRRSDGTERTAVVREAETYPVLDCGSPPEMAKKTATTYRITGS